MPKDESDLYKENVQIENYQGIIACGWITPRCLHKHLAPGRPACSGFGNRAFMECGVGGSSNDTKSRVKSVAGKGLAKDLAQGPKKRAT